MEPNLFQTSININAPIADLYAYLADFPRHIEWNHQPTALTPLQAGPIVVGSQFSTAEGVPRDMPAIQKLLFGLIMPIFRLIYGMEHNSIATITALNAPTDIAWEARLPARKGDVMRMTWRLTLEENADGTVVTQSGVVAPPANSPFARMVNAQFIEDRRVEVAGNLALLKTLVEANKH